MRGDVRLVCVPVLVALLISGSVQAQGEAASREEAVRYLRAGSGMLKRMLLIFGSFKSSIIY